MIADDWDRFVKALTALGVTLDQQQSGERLRLYWDALRSTRIEAIEWAARDAAKRFVWFPKPVELSRLAAVAPLAVLRLPVADGPVLLADPAKRSEDRKRLREVAEQMNKSFGTSFGVDDSGLVAKGSDG